MKKTLLTTLTALTATLVANGISTPTNDYLEPVVLPMIEVQTPAPAPAQAPKAQPPGQAKKNAPTAQAAKAQPPGQAKKKAPTAQAAKAQPPGQAKKNAPAQAAAAPAPAIPTFVTSQPDNQGNAIAPWVNGIFNDPNCILEVIASWKYENGTASWEGFVNGFTSAMFTITPTISTGGSTATIVWDLTGTGYGLFAVTGHQGGDKGTIKTNLNAVTDQKYVKGMGTIEAPGNGEGWSNMRLLGKRISVPDSGTTLALLGAALLGVIGFRRFKS